MFQWFHGLFSPENVHMKMWTSRINQIIGMHVQRYWRTGQEFRFVNPIFHHPHPHITWCHLRDHLNNLRTPEIRLWLDHVNWPVEPNLNASKRMMRGVTCFETKMWVLKFILLISFFHWEMCVCLSTPAFPLSFFNKGILFQINACLFLQWIIN